MTEAPALTALVAEDEEHIARLVQFKLAREGFNVRRVSNGDEAVAALGDPAASWSLVVLDVMMPGRDGWQVLQELRGRLGLKDVPVLMLSAKGRSEDQRQAATLGATGFIRKPFDPDELAHVARRLARAPAPRA